MRTVFDCTFRNLYYCLLFRTFCVKTTMQIPPISVYFNTRVSYCTDWWSIDSEIDERWILFPGLFLVNWVRKIVNTFLSYSIILLTNNCFWCTVRLCNIIKIHSNFIRLVWLQVFFSYLQFQYNKNVTKFFFSKKVIGWIVC